MIKSTPRVRTEFHISRSATTLSIDRGIVFNSKFGCLQASLLRIIDSSLRDVKEDDSNNEVAPSRGGEQIDDVLDGFVGAVVGCVSAWNKDPVFGVIGIQSGPRDKGPHWLPWSHGSRGWGAGGGDAVEDRAPIFCPWSADQGDLPGAWRIAQGSPQRPPCRGDGGPSRGGDAAASEDGPLECRA